MSDEAEPQTEFAEALGLGEEAPEPREQEVNEAAPEPAAEEELPEQYRGKSVREIIDFAEAAARQKAEAEKKVMHAGYEKNRAIEEANLLKAKLEVYSSMQPREERQLPRDPFEARGLNPEEDLFLDPRRTLSAVRDLAAEETLSKVDPRISRLEQHLVEREKKDFTQASFAASEAARQRAGVDEATWYQEVAPRILPSLFEKGPEALTNPESYVAEFDGIRAFAARLSPAASEAPASAPVPGNPPGAKRPAAARAAVAPSKPALSKSEEALFAGLIGDDPMADRILERYLAKKS